MKPLLLFCSLLFFSACVTIKQVNEFSKASADAVNCYKEVKCSFASIAVDDSIWKYTYSAVVVPQTFKPSKDALLNDTLISKSVKIISAYFKTMQKFTEKDLTKYNTDKLTKSLKDNKVSDESTATAVGSMVSAIANIGTNVYRLSKIKGFIKDAKQPLDVAFTKLKGELRALKENVISTRINYRTIYTSPLDLVGDPLFTVRKSNIAALYASSRAYDEKIESIDKYIQILDTLQAKNQKLYDAATGATKISLKTLGQLAETFAGDIEKLVSELFKDDDEE